MTIRGLELKTHDIRTLSPIKAKQLSRLFGYLDKSEKFISYAMEFYRRCTLILFTVTDIHIGRGV